MSAPAAIAGPMDMKARAAAVQSDIKSYDLDTLGDDTVGVSSRFTTQLPANSDPDPNNIKPC